MSPVFSEEHVAMTTFRLWFLAIGIAVMATGLSASPETIGHHPPDRSRTPRLINTCVISQNVKQLVEFYESILMMKAKWSTENYAEFTTGAGVLAIFSAEAQEKYIPGSAEALENKNVILEFRVADVDQEYRRLQSLVKTWVKPPSTQPWGTRSVYFRDPDGNLIDFYAPTNAR
jgi:catechol 2,3-dioxygenase-like lactoylglutathione lyase family enzyme